MKLFPRSQNRPQSLQPMHLRDAVNRLFDESFWDPFTFFSNPAQMPRLQSFVPYVDVSENDKEVRVEADIPGYDPKNINVEIEEGLLRISGKMDENKEEKNKTYYQKERRTGSFHYEVALPLSADSENASCKIKNGTLCIVMPKKKDKKGKSLEIEVE